MLRQFHTAQSRGSQLQLCSWLVIALFAVGHLLSITHAATTQHAFCAEHGKIIDIGSIGDGAHSHGDAHAAAHVDSEVDSDVDSADGIPDLRPGSPDGPGHDDHCQFCPSLRQPAHHVVAAFAYTAVAAQNVALKPPVTVALPTTRGYQLAPKTSPPA